jgi:hypothetical protein
MIPLIVGGSLCCALIGGCSPTEVPLSDARRVDEIHISPFGSGWWFRLRQDGSVDAQFGSSAGDSATLPPGSVDFPAILKSCEWLIAMRRSPDGSRPKVQIGFRLHDGVVIGSVDVSDETAIRELLESFDGKWKCLIGPRFREILESHPMFSDNDPSVR